MASSVHPEAVAARKTAFDEAAKLAEQIGRRHVRAAAMHNKARNYDALERHEALADQAFYIAGRIRAKR